jgi:hypothetical protein
VRGPGSHGVPSRKLNSINVSRGIRMIAKVNRTIAAGNTY